MQASTVARPLFLQAILQRWRRRRWALNIRQRFLAVNFVVVLSATFAFTAGELLLDLRSEQEAHRLRATRLLFLVEAIAGAYLPDGHHQQLHTILRRVADSPDIAAIRVFDDRRGVLVDTTAPTSPFIAGEVTNFFGDKTAWGERRLQEQDGALTLTFPLFVDAAALAVGQVAVPMPTVGELLAKLFARTGWVALAVVLISAPYAWLMLGRALKPLRQLSEACRCVSRGQISIEIDAQRHDEVGLLALRFRWMLRQLSRSLDRVYQLAFVDGVTELPNRECFRRSLEQALRQARTTGKPGAVLFLDLDRFKRVNDSLGHDFGDLLLQEFARRLRACTRASDPLVQIDDPAERGVDDASAAHRPTIARLGGDEFALLLPQMRRPLDAAAVARRILQATRAPFELRGHRVFVGVSVGVAIFPEDAQTVEDVLRAADLALYHAKDQGRDTFEYFSASLNQRAMERFALETELRNALEREEFELHYQPIVDPQSEALRGVEALLRWRHPKHGLICPNRFLGVAEETRMIVEIGAWVLKRACRQAEIWRAAGRPLRVSVNVSLAQFERPNFVERVLATLEEERLPPELLQLEITETLAMTDPAYTAAAIAPLRAAGVSFALDDFGTGYSSLSILSTLPIDSLKIDQSFIARADHDANARAIIETILAMARSLNHRTIAEGIEHASQAEYVSARGCTLVQGYLYSQPLPPAVLEAVYFPPPESQAKISA